MKKKFILVFGYTALHSLLLQDIKKGFERSNYECISFYRRPNENRFVYRLRQIIFFFWYRFKLLVGSDISILLPHPEHLLANYFFYSSRVEKIYIYEDGLMNYLHVELPEVLIKQARKKSILASFFLYKYKIIKGYLSGCEQRKITGTFVRLPEMMYLPEKHGAISKIDSAIVAVGSPNPNIALFVDQDIEAIYSKEEAARLRAKIYKGMSSFDKVYVKPHHNYWSEGKRFIGLPDNFELLSDELQSLTAEEVAVTLKVGSVWGFYSSALINAATMLNNVKCYSCASESHWVNTVEGDILMSDLLAKFGVKAL
ncbi:hypothetical protein QEM13_002330 [Pseudomonas putida]|nr:hypothetical protein [Pseudomonas putida]